RLSALFQRNCLIERRPHSELGVDLQAQPCIHPADQWEWKRGIDALSAPAACPPVAACSRGRRGPAGRRCGGCAPAPGLVRGPETGFVSAWPCGWSLSADETPARQSLPSGRRGADDRPRRAALASARLLRGGVDDLLNQRLR